MLKFYINSYDFNFRRIIFVDNVYVYKYRNSFHLCFVLFLQKIVIYAYMFFIVITILYA